MKTLFINKIIRALIGADLLLLSSFGLIEPIFAIFVTQQIKGGDIRVAGFAAGIYWILKAILQTPIGKLLDKTKGEKDDLYFLIFGYLLVAIVPFGYMLSSLPWHIYGLQILNSIGMAMAYPAWCAIFTRHIDKGKEGLEWGSYGTLTSLGIGAASIVGGVLVTLIGFKYVFLIIGIAGIISSLTPLTIRKYIIPRNKLLSIFHHIHRPF